MITLSSPYIVFVPTQEQRIRAGAGIKKLREQLKANVAGQLRVADRITKRIGALTPAGRGKGWVKSFEILMKSFEILIPGPQVGGLLPCRGICEWVPGC